MSILLSEEQREIEFEKSRQEQHHNNLTGRNDRFEYLLAKAAAIHAVQYLEETCGCIADRVSEGGWPYKHPIEHRYECTTHMAEIHKELWI
jgi:hypothetical protein